VRILTLDRLRLRCAVNTLVLLEIWYSPHFAASFVTSVMLRDVLTCYAQSLPSLDACMIVAEILAACRIAKYIFISPSNGSNTRTLKNLLSLY